MFPIHYPKHHTKRMFRQLILASVQHSVQTLISVLMGVDLALTWSIMQVDTLTWSGGTVWRIFLDKKLEPPHQGRLFLLAYSVDSVAAK